MIIISIILLWILVTTSLFLYSGYLYVKSKIINKKTYSKEYKEFLNGLEHNYGSLLSKNS